MQPGKEGIFMIQYNLKKGLLGKCCFIVQFIHLAILVISYSSFFQVFVTLPKISNSICSLQCQNCGTLVTTIAETLSIHKFNQQ